MVKIGSLALVVLWTCIHYTTQGGKVLLLTPNVAKGSKSHLHLMTAVGEAVAKHGGHQVTLVLQGKECTLLSGRCTRVGVLGDAVLVFAG